MISKEDRESIISETIERVFKLLPETLGNLMQSHVVYADMRKKFYENNPLFMDHKDVVATVVSKIEGNNPGMGYDEILEKATPIIKNQIGTITKMKMHVPEKNKMNTLYDLTDNGAL